MRFDDRLATVLDQPAVDAHGRAVQWRQLVELVARGSGQGSSDLQDRALERIARLMDEVPAAVLAATARAIAARHVPPELVALFAARGAQSSAALLAAADLSPAGWAAVRAVAAPDVLPILASLGVDEPGAPFSEPDGQADDARKEKFAAAEAPAAGLFRWECGPTGEIDWVEGGPRAALIGRNLTEPFADRFAARLPFSDEPLSLAEEGALAGEWRWSGTPAFFPDTGRFAGYRGIAKRDGVKPAPVPPAPALPEDDDLRELMHELRTPLNAIIGFGEIIEGQYLGPAHRSYRDRASEIVRQARRLADAVDNLDLAAKLRSGRYHGDGTADLDIVRRALAGAKGDAEQAGVNLRIEDRGNGGRLSLPAPLAERLVRQFTGALVEASSRTETLGVTLDRMDTQLAIGIDRPAAFHGFNETQLLAEAGVGGTRFALRLVQGLAAMIGGRLDIAANRLVLLLPLSR